MSLEMSAKKSIALKKSREPCMKLAVYERGGLQDDTIHYWNERFGDKCTVVTSGTAWVDFIPFVPIRQKALKNIRRFWESDRKNVSCLVMNTMILPC